MVIIQHPTEPNENEPNKYSKTVEFGGRSDRGKGYLAHSDRVGPGVLLLHEWFGLQDSFKQLADRLCDEGFTVLAPDMYEGYVASNVEEAEAKMKSVDEEAVARIVKAGASFLTDNWHPRLGVIGFSFGAWFAAALAMELPAEAAVLYYGNGPSDPEGWTGPLLCHFAEHDEFDSREDMAAWVAQVQEAGVDVEACYYDVGHWFANPSAPTGFDPEANELAFQRTLEFLRHNLA